MYFESDPKAVYMGHREAVPKLVRCVESDQSMIAATT